MPYPSSKDLCPNEMRALPLLLLLWAAAAHGQAALTGRVTDTAGQPLPGAHVYLAGTTVGTATDRDGRFALGPLPAGAHRVVASMVGYTPVAIDLLLRAGEHRQLTLRLEEAVRTLEEVRVEAVADRRWQRRYQRFERALIGASTFAREVTILNPEVLSFTDRWGILRAEAAAPLLIENRALGYRLRYELTVFEASATRVRYHGEPFFEELEPADEAEAARWAANRRTAYAGSLRHLLRALLADRLEEEGFTLMHRPEAPVPGRPTMNRPGWLDWPRPTSARRLLRPPRDDDDHHELRFPGLLEVTFRAPEDEGFLTWEWNHERLARPRPSQHSTIFLEARSVRIDDRGEPADPFAIVRMGYLAFRRLAMLLPVEYGLETAPGAEPSELALGDTP